ncbi:MAG: sulfatase-like hydrolase/transferase [Kiritimatiellaeota bacterium]|nr:sulfatase-like hydrolase/transferase [Kiritimatiellota bacterium]
MKPNILFFFPDQLRFDWLGLSGMAPIRTPNLARLAEGGVVFSNAVTPSPLCAPARACLAAGREYEDCGTPDNGVDFPIDRPTVYRALRAAGYHVMGCGKFDLAKARCDWQLTGKRLLDEWGFSDGIDSEGKWDAVNSGRTAPRGPFMAFLEERGLRQIHVRDFDRRRRVGPAATFPTPLPEDAYGDNWVAQNGLELLERSPRNRPWFLQVNFPGPHAPWDITRQMERSCRELRNLPTPVGGGDLTPEAHLRIRQNYSAMVENIDRWVGVYLDWLEKRGMLQNTLVVFSSDHGEMLGDHGLWGKSVPYHPSIAVPLLVAGPGIEHARRIAAPTTILDLAATFLDFGGCRSPSDVESRSLRPLLEGRACELRKTVRSGLHRWRTVFDGRWKLVSGFSRGLRVGADGIELFDLANDPGETRNIATECPGVADRLRRMLR